LAGVEGKKTEGFAQKGMNDRGGFPPVVGFFILILDFGLSVW